MTVLNGNLWLSLVPERALGDGSYPPYNIELVPATETALEALRITFAVAGFRLDDLAVSVEDGELIVTGKQPNELARDYLHRGIAARRFKRSFALQRGVEVRKAELHNGLLTVELEKPERQRKVVKVGISATT
jgi:HSP20 family molecular chaperone IbpA